MKNWFWLFLLLGLMGCGRERADLNRYLGAVGEELKVVRQISQDCRRDALEISEKRPEEGLRRAELRIQEYQARLEESHQRFLKLQPPEKARGLHGMLDRDYQLWSDCGRQALEITRHGQTALSDAQTGPPAGKLRRLGEAWRDLRTRGLQLRVSADEAGRLLEEAGEEARRLTGKSSS